MLYSKEKTECISFPMGGIGSGSIGIAGNGRLIDWEIFNAPNKGSLNGISHFAIRAEENGKVTDVRVLNGDLAPHYIGDYFYEDKHFGFGYGPAAGTLCNLPHFRKHTFEGTYPVCHLEFSGEKFPAKTSLTAWSVMIPGESLPSSLPAAFFEIELENNTDREITYTALGVLTNPWSENPDSVNKFKDNCLTCFDGSKTGDITMAIDSPGSDISYQTYLFKGRWKDSIEVYFHDLLAGGNFKDRLYPTGYTVQSSGLAAARFTLPPGAKKTSRFIISWSIPVRAMENYPGRKERAEANNVKWTWKNFYAVCWKNSIESAKYALKNYKELRCKTFLFRDAVFNGTLPDVIKEAVSANLAILKSPTCLRLEDGTFYAWEGVSTKYGCCEGSCSHVLNYAQALPFLFPDLERSMRESHLKYSVDVNGGSHFRLLLPLGIHAETGDHRPCADGQFGDIMKIYRDWKIGGDNNFIRRYWSTIKQTIEFAWSDKNPDLWDPDETGVLTGRQHHTLDMELFGANSWLTGHYLGALAAAAELADFMKDTTFAEKCRRIFRKGYATVNKELFNGEYFTQSIDLKNKGIIDKFDATSYWSDEHKELKYQISGGCGIDAALAQTYADIYGLTNVFDRKKYRKSLQSVYKYNFKKSMRDFINLWRVYSLNDEAGTIICTWPKGNKPIIPLTYNSETMPGFEWMFAAALASQGYVKKSLRVAKAIRDRFDGRKRNPYNEFECGSNYSRSMASYAMLPALSGFRYDRNAGMLGFAPVIPGIFQSFWALGDIWGLYFQDDSKAKITLLHGTFSLKKLLLPRKFDSLILPVTLNAGDTLEIPFAKHPGNC